LVVAGVGDTWQVDGPYISWKLAKSVRVVTSVVVTVLAMVVVTGTSSVRYGGVTVVVVDLVTTGVKHEQASKRTELETPLKSNNGYFKSGCTELTRRSLNLVRRCSTLNKSLHHSDLGIATYGNGGGGVSMQIRADLHTRQRGSGTTIRR
jgi:hypothetical protein